MVVIPDQFVNADSTVNRAVLLSERTQLLFLTALDAIEFQSAWEEMTDEAWNLMEGWLGDAQSQILIEVESGGDGVNVEQKTVSLSSDNAYSGAQSSTAVLWDTGDYDATDNSKVYVDNTGRFIISVNADIDSAGGNRCELEIWINGAFYVGLIQSASANRSNAITCHADLSDGDYVQLKVSSNGSVTLATGVWATRLDVTGFYA